MDKATKFKETCDRAFQIIEANPGLTRDRLAVKLGLPNSKTDKRRDSVARRIVKRLEAAGKVEVKKDRFADAREQPKIYPVGYVPPARKPLFQPFRAAYSGECRAFKVPLSELRHYTRV